MDLKDSLDSDIILNSKANIRYHNGFTFGISVRIAAAVLLVIGIAALISGGPGYIVGPILLLGTPYVLSSTYGTEISLSNNYVRNYSSSFGIKRGKWKSTIHYPDITILKLGKATAIHNFQGVKSVVLAHGIYEVLLLTGTHRQRMLLRETTSSEEALQVAEELAEKMNKKLTQFNPAISKKTLARRYERH